METTVSSAEQYGISGALGGRGSSHCCSDGLRIEGSCGLRRKRRRGVRDRLRGVDDPLVQNLVELAYLKSDEHVLWAAVLVRALLDARICWRSQMVGAMVTKDAWQQAVEWLLDDSMEVGSYRWIMEALGVDSGRFLELITEKSCPECGVEVLREWCECHRRRSCGDQEPQQPGRCAGD